MGGPPWTPGHATALISEIALVWMGHFLLDCTDKSTRVFLRDLDGEGGSKEYSATLQLPLFFRIAFCYCHVKTLVPKHVSGCFACLLCLTHTFQVLESLVMS